MPLKGLKTLSSKSLHKNPYWEYKIDSYTLPDGSVGEYHYVHSPGSIMAIAVDHEGNIVLVKQVRYLWKKESIEFPGGGVKERDFLRTAKDELAEEAAVGASEWRLVGEFNPFNGAADEVCRVYFATSLSKVVKEMDRSEEFEVLRMTVEEFQSLIDKGEVWDGMTLAAWSLAKKTVLDYLSVESHGKEIRK